MGGWLCSTEFFNIPEVIKIIGMQCGSDRAFIQRTVILIKLLSMCADGIKCGCPRELLRNLCGTRYMLDTVSQTWQMCYKEGILRQDGDSYSTLSWMVEKGLLADCTKKASTRGERKTTPKDSHKTEEAPQIETSRKETATPPVQPARPPLQEVVRPQVMLSRIDLDELRKNHSEEEISEALDFYSDWKIRGNKMCKNDAEQINRWVFDAVKKTKAKAKKQETDLPPDWDKHIPEWM